jgi:hypothetical protein
MRKSCAVKKREKSQLKRRKIKNKKIKMRNIIKLRYRIAQRFPRLDSWARARG